MTDEGSFTSPDLALSTRRELLAFGDTLVASTRSLILDLWGRDDFETSWKQDLSPVTALDLQAEALVREAIQRHHPSHGIIGEEFGVINPDSEFQWTIDPVDGTENLINRIPTFGTLIGLRFRNKPILGFIDHPVLGQYCRGGEGLGVFCNDRRVRLDKICGRENAAVIATGTLKTFEQGGQGEKFFRILRAFPSSRIYYDCYAHLLTLTGGLAATVECNLKIWDLTPAEALVGEIGGTFCFLGEPLVKDGVTLLSGAFGRTAIVEQIASIWADELTGE